MGKKRRIKVKFDRVPCVKCGDCCKASVCEIAETLGLSSTSPCSALEFTEGFYFCGIAINPVKHIPDSIIMPDYKKAWMGKYIRKLMKFGYGCTNEEKYESTGVTDAKDKKD